MFTALLYDIKKTTVVHKLKANFRKVCLPTLLILCTIIFDIKCNLKIWWKQKFCTQMLHRQIHKNPILSLAENKMHGTHSKPETWLALQKQFCYDGLNLLKKRKQYTRLKLSMKPNFIYTCRIVNFPLQIVLLYYIKPETHSTFSAVAVSLFNFHKILFSKRVQFFIRFDRVNVIKKLLWLMFRLL